MLSDNELMRLNGLLPWQAYTVDSNGGRFGNLAWRSKRESPSLLPDPRIVEMNKRFGLRDARILEIGCFEGIHTAGLCQYSHNVTAIDARIEHVVKTIVRCAMFGFHPTVFVYDVESQNGSKNLFEADFGHHVGVLYHLQDPVSHLHSFISLIKTGFMLDTHYANPDETDKVYRINGKEFHYKNYVEFGREEPFSGIYDHSKWLLLDDIISVVQKGGFNNIDIAEKRQEWNGPRVLLFASRD